MNIKTTYLYCLNFPNGKKYIGYSENPTKRLGAHIRAAKRGVAYPVYSAIRKHGTPNLQILCTGHEDYITTLEVVAIKHFQTRDKATGYNVAFGGIGGSGNTGNYVDITNQRFGRLVAVNPTNERSGSSVMWSCVCDCGNMTIASAAFLQIGSTKSCGCLRSETCKAKVTTHGKSHTPEYHIYANILRRCFNKYYRDFYKYGGKGITMGKRWRHSFENFYEDMGPRPSPKHQLRRIDASKGYYKENCYWASPR